MTGLEWNLDSLLVGVPMVIVLAAGVFRLDELVSAPRRIDIQRARTVGWDENGKLNCTDPDGRRSATSSGEDK
jgi:hypothetical protein